jgi:3-hydroxyisobutyrate dehydrogenase-like beta-hydroxyacid dehydrogenase
VFVGDGDKHVLVSQFSELHAIGFGGVRRDTDHREIYLIVGEQLQQLGDEGFVQRHRDFWVSAAKRGNAVGYQRSVGGGEGTHPESSDVQLAQVDELTECNIDPVEDRFGVDQEATAGLGWPHSARLPIKQLRTDFAFERGYLPRYRRLCVGEQMGCPGEGARVRDFNEHPKRSCCQLMRIMHGIHAKHSLLTSLDGIYREGMTSRNVAFLGLGTMGTPMARRLIDAGHSLTVWNRSPQRAEQFATEGIAVAATPAEAVSAADVVITMLADPAAVRQVVSEVAASLRPGTILIEASTVGPDVVREVVDSLPAGVTVVDAPVMGSADRAASGTLTLLVGGDADPVLDLLELFGTVTRCGSVGSGAALKVVLISAVVVGVTAIGEAMAVADALGLPEDLVKAAMAQSPVAGIAGRAFAQGSHFAIRLAAKDVALAAASADLPVTRAVHTRLLEFPAEREEDLGQIVAAIRASQAQLKSPN